MIGIGRLIAKVVLLYAFMNLHFHMHPSNKDRQALEGIGEGERERSGEWGLIGGGGGEGVNHS